MKKEFEMKMLCDKCGAEQKKDEKQSTKHWKVYKAGKKCECGGEFKPDLINLNKQNETNRNN